MGRVVYQGSARANLELDEEELQCPPNGAPDLEWKLRQCEGSRLRERAGRGLPFPPDSGLLQRPASHARSPHVPCLQAEPQAPRRPAEDGQPAVQRKPVAFPVGRQRMGVTSAERRQQAAERSARVPPGLGAQPARCTYSSLCRGFPRRAGCAVLGPGGLLPGRGQ